MEKEYKKLHSLILEESRVEVGISKEVRKVFPKGKIVIFNRWNTTIKAEVVMTSRHRIKVRNLETEKEYWIQAWDVLYC